MSFLVLIKVAQDSCEVTHSLTHASIHTKYVQASKSCTEYSLQLGQSTSRHANLIMLYGVKCSMYKMGQWGGGGGEGAIHKLALALGDSPTLRALRGNRKGFSSQRSLPHLAKHFFLCFLFLLQEKASYQRKSFRHYTPYSSQC